MICAADLSDHDTNAQWRNLQAVNFSRNCCTNATGSVLHSSEASAVTTPTYIGVAPAFQPERLA
jgi:hypothetical protein